MKKLFITIIFICMGLTVNAITSYDSYGNKTGSYNTNGNIITQYDRYGNKTGSYK